MVIISARLCYFFGLFSGFPNSIKAVTVFPFIFVKDKNEMPAWLINHEKIHIRQQFELLFFGAVCLHIIEITWAVIFMRKSWLEAYYWSSVEQEAYRNQYDMTYLTNRKTWSQIHYLFDKRKISHKDGVVTYLD